MFKDVPYKSPDGSFSLAKTYVDLKRIVTIDPLAKTGQIEIGYWQDKATYAAGKPPISSRTIDFSGELFGERWEKIENKIMELVTLDIITIPQVVPGEFEDDPAPDNKPGKVSKLDAEGKVIPDEFIDDPTFVPRKRAVKALLFANATPA